MLNGLLARILLLVCIFLFREYFFWFLYLPPSQAYGARLAQSVEHETLNLRVVGSSPTLGVSNLFIAGEP